MARESVGRHGDSRHWPHERRANSSSFIPLAVLAGVLIHIVVSLVLGLIIGRVVADAARHSQADRLGSTADAAAVDGRKLYGVQRHESGNT